MISLLIFFAWLIHHWWNMVLKWPNIILSGLMSVVFILCNLVHQSSWIYAYNSYIILTDYSLYSYVVTFFVSSDKFCFIFFLSYMSIPLAFDFACFIYRFISFHFEQVCFSSYKVYFFYRQVVESFIYSFIYLFM
jgi:hypothetical protein